jgi:hypothetical protein
VLTSQRPDASGKTRLEAIEGLDTVSIRGLSPVVKIHCRVPPAPSRVHTEFSAIPLLDTATMPAA